MSNHRLTTASLRFAALATLGLCASTLTAQTTLPVTSSEMTDITSTRNIPAVPADSMSVELRAIFALLEHSQQLNETAVSLLREAVKASQTPREIKVAPQGLIQHTANDTVSTALPTTPEVNALPDFEPAPAEDQMVAEAVGGSQNSVDALEVTPLSGEEIEAIIESDPEILHDRNMGRYHRGLFNYRFIPKGDWAFGLTASYGEFSTDDLQMFDLISDVDLSGHSFSIKPQMQYFLRDNLSIGLRLNYTQTRGDIDSFKLEIDEDMNFNIHDVGYKGESYAAALTLTQYLGLSRRGRFGVFNEVELAFSSGNSDFRRPFGENIRTTHTTTTGVSLTYSPGVSVFVMKNASFGVSFGVFGFTLKNEKQWVDGVSSGNRLTSGANFRFNIFNINFGISIHL